MKEEQKKIGKSSDGREMHYSAGVLVECDGMYLLLDRINPPPGFACPSGHIDEGEDPKTCAIRELREETGIIVKDIEFICEEEILWNYCKSAAAHYWYLFKVSVNKKEVIIDKTEARSIGWYTIDQMRSMNLEEVWQYWFKKLNILK